MNPVLPIFIVTGAGADMAGRSETRWAIERAPARRPQGGSILLKNRKRVVEGAKKFLMCRCLKVMLIYGEVSPPGRFHLDMQSNLAGGPSQH